MATIGKEIHVNNDFKLPKDYKFVPKGDAYRTRSLSLATREANKPIFIISNESTRTGIAVPIHIFTTVVQTLKSTAPIRLLARQASQSRDYINAKTVLERLFPKFPLPAEEALKAFRVGSGKVGRAGTLDLEDKVRLAVAAKARHVFTKYEALLKEGVGRQEARTRTFGVVQRVLKEWSGEDDAKAIPKTAKLQAGEGSDSVKVSVNKVPGRKRIRLLPPQRTAKKRMSKSKTAIAQCRKSQESNSKSSSRFHSGIRKAKSGRHSKPRSSRD